MERFPRQGYLNTQIPSDGFGLVYKILDRKINEAMPAHHPEPPRSRTLAALVSAGASPARRPQRLPLGPGAWLGPLHGAPEPVSHSRVGLEPQLRLAPLKAPSARPAGAVVGLFFSAVIFKTLTFRGISQILPVKT